MAMIFQEPMTALNPVEPVGKQIDEVLRVHGQAGQNTSAGKGVGHARLGPPATGRETDLRRLSTSTVRRAAATDLVIFDGPDPRAQAPDRRRADHGARCHHAGADSFADPRVAGEEHNTAVMFITHDFGVVAENRRSYCSDESWTSRWSGRRSGYPCSDPREAYTRMLVSSVPSLIPKKRETTSGEIVLDVAGLNKTLCREAVSAAGAR